MKIFRTRKKEDGVMIILDSKDSGVSIIAPNGDKIEIVVSDNPEHDGFSYDIRLEAASINGTETIYPKR